MLCLNRRPVLGEMDGNRRFQLQSGETPKLSGAVRRLGISCSPDFKKDCDDEDRIDESLLEEEEDAENAAPTTKMHRMEQRAATAELVTGSLADACSIM